MGNVFAGDGQDTLPPFKGTPTFDSLEGFPNGRKPRVMIATEEEMKAARLKPEERDYCAHILLQLEQCRIEKWPWIARCGDVKHHWDECEFQDYVLRMKEYERERRLLERKKAKQQAAAT